MQAEWGHLFSPRSVVGIVSRLLVPYFLNVFLKILIVADDANVGE